MARVRGTPQRLATITQTEIDSVFFSRIYHEYIRIEAEADQGAALARIESYDNQLQHLCNSITDDFSFVYSGRGFGIETHEIQSYRDLVTTTKRGVGALWDAAVISESVAEFKKLVRESTILVE